MADDNEQTFTDHRAAVGAQVQRGVRRTGVTQTADGMRHAWSPIGGSEHTLCGIAAMEAHETENMPEWAPVKATGTTVTCPECATVVLACRGVRVSAPNA